MRSSGHDAGDAAMAAGFLTEPAVDLHPPPLAGADQRPVALRIVGHQAGPDDADPIVRRIAAGSGQRLPPRIQRAGARALRQQIGVEARRPQRARLGQRGDP